MWLKLGQSQVRTQDYSDVFLDKVRNLSEHGRMTVQPVGGIPEWTMGDRLRKAREELELGQREFAERIGVSKQTVTNAEKGHREVRKITLNAWALVTGVPLEWLETGEVAPTPPGGSGADDETRTRNNLLGMQKIRLVA